MDAAPGYEETAKAGPDWRELGNASERDRHLPTMHGPAPIGSPIDAGSSD